MTNLCSLCEKVTTIDSDSPYFIHEFTHSVLMIGEHQAFRGYCVLVLKTHVGQLLQLPSTTQLEFYQELLISANAINSAFKPKQINYACYGNKVPHLHWHLFPRYENDLCWPEPVWSKMAEFKNFKINESEAISLKELLVPYFKGHP